MALYLWTIKKKTTRFMGRRIPYRERGCKINENCIDF